MKKGILFDLDGTLWNSDSVITDAWNEYLEHQTDLPYRCTVDMMHSYMGKTYEDIAAAFLPELSKEEQVRLIGELYDQELAYMPSHRIPLFPEEESVLRTLAEEYELGIVSNCGPGYIDIFLNQCGFAELFADTQFFDGLTKSKGENIVRVMERRGMDSCVYVGDTQGDCDAAAEAGIPFIHAAFGYGTVSVPCRRAKRFADLPELLIKRA